jgi:hypothetical protein
MKGELPDGNQLVRDPRPKIFATELGFEAIAPGGDFLDLCEFLAGAAEPDVHILGLNSEVLGEILHRGALGSGCTQCAQNSGFQSSAFSGRFPGGCLGGFRCLGGFQSCTLDCGDAALAAATNFALHCWCDGRCDRSGGAPAGQAEDGGFDLFEFSTQCIPLLSKFKQAAKCGCINMGCIHEQYSLANGARSLQAKYPSPGLC